MSSKKYLPVVNLIDCQEFKEKNKRMLKCEISKKEVIDKKDIITIVNQEEKING